MTTDYEIDDTPPKKTPERLQELWQKVAKGEATSQERVDAAWLAGELGDRPRIEPIKALLDDEDEEVRYYALQALVLDLQENSPEMVEVCWRFLENDPDEYVRSMSATCLASIYFGQKRKDVFDRFAKILHAETEVGFVKGSAYSALHKLAGLPPSEWPGLWGPRKVFEESDIDWGRVAELESLMI